MSRVARNALLLVLLTSLVAVRAPSATQQEARKPIVAVIVNPKNKTGNLTLAELRRIMMGQKKTFGGGRNIVLLQRPSRSVEGRTLLKHVYRMSSRKLRKYWVSQLFKGRIKAIPTTVPKARGVLRAVARHPGAISVVLLTDVNRSVKVLSIDGHKPGEKGYPLIGGEKP